MKMSKEQGLFIKKNKVKSPRNFESGGSVSTR